MKEYCKTTTGDIKIKELDPSIQSRKWVDDVKDWTGKTLNQNQILVLTRQGRMEKDNKPSIMSASLELPTEFKQSPSKETQNMTEGLQLTGSGNLGVSKNAKHSLLLI